jgi:hypothetical protein
MVRIEREALNALGFDLAQAVSEYQAALEAHRFTVGVPRPTSHPFVEMVVAKGSAFEIVDPVVEEKPEPPSLPEPPLVPQQVSLARARIVLRQQGLFDAIDAGLKALPEPQRSVALEAWEYENYVSRDGLLVTSLAGQFGLTDEQLDDLFIAAAAIKL